MSQIRVDNPFGFRDYVGVGPKDLIADLQERQMSTSRSAQVLSELRPRAKERLDSFKESDALTDANGILDFVDYMVDLFEGYSADYLRLVNELQGEVFERHIRILNQIYESSKKEQIRCRSFKNSYIVRAYDAVVDKALRPLLDLIYEETASLLFDNLNLTNLSRRLETYIGSSTTVPTAEADLIARGPSSRGITPLQIPGGTKWADITIQFISRQSVQIDIKGAFSGVKTFIELGFKDRKSKYGQPDKIWRTFYVLAFGEGTFPDGSLDHKDLVNLKHHLSILRKRLKYVFGIAEDPFYPFYPDMKYVSIFQISSRPEVDEEELAGLRRQEEFRKDYGQKAVIAAEEIARSTQKEVGGIPDEDE